MHKPSAGDKPKATFAPSSLAKLRAITGENNGEPLLILLSDIDEDPDQPRKVIDPSDLEPLAATIRSHGVLQPVGVYPPIEGRYRLAFGARRLRASHIAKKLEIPAVIVAKAQRNFTSQVIENQQRVDLSNSDLAAAVHQLSDDDVPTAQIAIICNLKEYQVSAYRAVSKFPGFLVDRLNSADVRALYDLYRQWSKTPAEVEGGLPEADTFLTITDARRLIESITGKTTGSIVLQPRRDEDGSNAGLEGNPIIASEPHLSAPATPAPEGLENERSMGELASKHNAKLAQAKPPVSIDDNRKTNMPIFVVAIGDGEPGQLVVGQRGKTAGWALVRFPTGIEEVEFNTLRNIAIE